MLNDKRRGPGTPINVNVGPALEVDYGPIAVAGRYRRRPGSPVIPLAQIQRERGSRTPGISLPIAPGLAHLAESGPSREIALRRGGLGEVDQVYGPDAKSAEAKIISDLRGRDILSPTNADVAAILRVTSPESVTFLNDMDRIVLAAKKLKAAGKVDDDDPHAIQGAVSELEVLRQQQKESGEFWNRTLKMAGIGALTLAILNYVTS